MVRCFRVMEKKLTNSGPFMKSTGKHSIYPYPPLLLFGRCDLADATPASRLLWQPIGAPGDYEGRDRRDDHVRGR